MKGQAGFFDLDERYAALPEAGNPLERLVTAVDFELFCHQIWSALNRPDCGQGGRPLYDPVLMFKVLVLQALYNLSDDQAEFQIRDRLSFMRFLGLGRSDADSVKPKLAPPTSSAHSLNGMRNCNAKAFILVHRRNSSRVLGGSQGVFRRWIAGNAKLQLSPGQSRGISFVGLEVLLIYDASICISLLSVACESVELIGLELPAGLVRQLWSFS